MQKFIDYLVGDDKELPTNWDEIYSEYITLRENKNTFFILQLVKELMYLKNKAFIIATCIEVLVNENVPELAQELKDAGCRGRFDWDDPIGYSNDIRAAYSECKRINQQVRRKQKDLDDYNKEYGGSSAVTRKHFDDYAVEITRFFKIHIDFEIITVARWCSYVNKFEAYCEVKNSEKDAVWQKTE